MKNEVVAALEKMLFYDNDSRYIHRSDERIYIVPFDMANFRTRETNGDGPTAFIVAEEYQKIGYRLAFSAMRLYLETEFSHSVVRVQKEILELAADAMRQSCLALLYAEQMGEKIESVQDEVVP